MLIDMSFYCRACRGCRVHCRDTKTIPVVPRQAFISVPDSMVRYKKLLKSPKHLLSLKTAAMFYPKLSHQPCGREACPQIRP